MIQTPVPASLAWRLTKDPGRNSYDALVGEGLWMYGTYPDSSVEPSCFRPFEVYERTIRHWFSRLHI